MKATHIILLVLSIFFSSSLIAENQPAFPGAEGFGRYTAGGRGGVVYHVTSLADDGSAGTLRWALKQSGRRTIVFDVSGTIHLTSALSLSNGFCTIAGQTAPGDGICIADYPFTITSSNNIVRFLRFRLGNTYVAYHEGDGLGAMDNQDIIIDHCSVSWSIDECLSVLGNKNATVQWCISSQSLRNAGHVKGPHGYGGNWGGTGMSYHHNLMCHHDSRTPRLGPRATTQTDERMDMRNNVIYNWGGLGCYGGEGMNVNIVNNYYKPGPGTKQKTAGIQYRIASIGIRTTSYINSYPAYAPMWQVWGDFYVDGNFINEHSDVTADNWTKGIYAQTTNGTGVDNTYTQTTQDTMKLLSPIEYYYTTTHTAEKAYEKVLKYAGASLSRDWVDSLMISDTQNGKASYTGAGNIYGIINSQNDNKPLNAPADWSPWPVLKSTGTPTDTDQDGMPDTWETANGLDLNNAADRNTINPEGYTMLEVYINSLVAHIMTDENTEGVATGIELGGSGNTNTTFLINQTTYVGATGASSPWNFDSNVNITNTNSKTYATGSELGIKYSSGVPFTVNLPAGYVVDSVKFTGYDNYADLDSYLSELNGSVFDSDKYVFNQKDINGNYTVCNYTVPLENPATGSFVFKFDGKQVVISMLLYAHLSTGIKSTYISPLDPDALINVYDLNGRTVRMNVLRRNALEQLNKGVYILDGQKVFVNN